MADDGGRAGPGPRSWAEDLQTYRSTRGARSYNTVKDTTVQERYARTNYVPFCDTRHPLFPYNDFVDGKDTVRIDPTTTADRFARHGWGDTTLLKEDLGPRRRGEDNTCRSGKARLPSPRGPDGRTNLYGVLQMTEAGARDDWLGNPLIQPDKGRRAVPPPRDAKGRRDMFDVLHCRAPGGPADDAWLGNKLIDPAKGRAHPPGPEQLRGRQNLTDVLAMGIMHDPRRLDLLRKGADPLGDVWIGNKLIDPTAGKRNIHSSPAAVELLHGAVFRPDSYDKTVPAAFIDQPRRHARAVEPPAPDTAAVVISGEAGFADDRGRLGKKPFPHLPAPRKYDGRRDMYAHMTYKPLSDVEKVKYGVAFDDTGPHGRRVLPVPGSDDPAKGPDMLQWKPEARVGHFVPHGGLAQEGRVKGSKLRGTAGR